MQEAQERVSITLRLKEGQLGHFMAGDYPFCADPGFVVYEARTRRIKEVFQSKAGEESEAGEEASGAGEESAGGDSAGVTGPGDCHPVHSGEAYTGPDLPAVGAEPFSPAPSSGGRDNSLSIKRRVSEKKVSHSWRREGREPLIFPWRTSAQSKRRVDAKARRFWRRSSLREGVLDMGNRPCGRPQGGGNR